MRVFLSETGSVVAELHYAHEVDALREGMTVSDPTQEDLRSFPILASQICSGILWTSAEDGLRGWKVAETKKDIAVRETSESLSCAAAIGSGLVAGHSMSLQSVTEGSVLVPAELQCVTCMAAGGDGTLYCTGPPTDGNLWICEFDTRAMEWGKRHCVLQECLGLQLKGRVMATCLTYCAELRACFVVVSTLIVMVHPPSRRTAIVDAGKEVQMWNLGQPTDAPRLQCNSVFLVLPVPSARQVWVIPSMSKSAFILPLSRWEAREANAGARVGLKDDGVNAGEGSAGSDADDGEKESEDVARMRVFATPGEVGQFHSLCLTGKYTVVSGHRSGDVVEWTISSGASLELNSAPFATSSSTQTSALAGSSTTELRQAAGLTSRVLGQKHCDCSVQSITCVWGSTVWTGDSDGAIAVWR